MPKLKIPEDAQPDFLTEDEIETLLDLCSEPPLSEFVKERDQLDRGELVDAETVFRRLNRKHRRLKNERE